MTRRTSGSSAGRLDALLGDDATPTVMTGETSVAAEAPGPDVVPDPDAYGVRVVWQSEEELLEAAEFLLATRIRRDDSLRVLHDVHSQPEPDTGAQAEGVPGSQ